MASIAPREDYEFLADPDDDLKCVICLEVARDPLQHEECGKLFCKQCLDRHGRDKPCPNCREGNSQYYVDKRGRRAIDALGVKCNNENCKWKGTIETVKKHVATCPYTPIPCPKNCYGSIIYLLRKDLDDHLENHCPNRDHICQYCGKVGTFAEITEVHEEVCEEKIIPCSNAECAKAMSRRLIETHVATECNYTLIPCKYKSFGCDVKLKRQDMGAHEQDSQLHLDNAMETTLQLKGEVEELKKDLKIAMHKIGDLTSEKTITLKHEGSITFALKEFQEYLDDDEVFWSPSFYTHPRGYHVVITVLANGHFDGEESHVSVRFNVLEGKYDAKLEWPFDGDVTISLLNQLEDYSHHSKTIHVTPGKNIIVGRSKSYRKFISHDQLEYHPFKNCQYLKCDTLYFKVSVDITDHKPWLECTKDV